MNRKSSFEPSPPGSRNSHAVEPFPLFEPIRDGNSLSHRLSLAGIDVNKYHVQALHVPSGNDVNGGHHQHQQHQHRGNKSASSSRSNSGSVKSNRQQQSYDCYGPRFSQVTLSRHDEPKLHVTDVYRNPIVSSVIQQTPVRQQFHYERPSLVADPYPRESSIEDTANQNDANDNDLDDSCREAICRRDSSSRRRPSSVEDEMNNGKGFKNWARNQSRLYTKNPRTTGNPQIFNKQFMKGNRGMDPTVPDREVKLQCHTRRLSNTNGVGGCMKNRRSSIMQTIFGESGNRRFSEDLRASIKSNYDPDDGDSEGYHVSVESETAKVIFFQVFIPFLIAGFGNVGAGLILDYTQHWAVFRSTPELFVLIASFIGFKGNLEMTLAARLSTIANLGEMDTTRAQIRVGIGNVCLVQGQAIVLAFLAAAIAIAISYFKEFMFEPESWLLILATSLVTASFTGFVLPVLTVIVTILSRKAGINPDNVSTLTTAFLGDLSAVVMLCYSARFFFNYRPVVWLEPCVIAFFIILLPICLYTARQNEYTRDIVGNGWIPIIIAMVISSFAGLIFDFAVQKYQTIAIFQPIINGVGSNLVAVHASRISTYLHLRCKLGSLPVDDDGLAYESCQSPWAAFFGSNQNAKTARLLLLMSIPGHIIYVVTIRLIESGTIFVTLSFLTCYLIVSIVQVIVLLYMAHVIVPSLWSRKVDPDNAAIPGIMSCGDLLGTAFLTTAYVVLASVGSDGREGSPEEQSPRFAHHPSSKESEESSLLLPDLSGDHNQTEDHRVDSCVKKAGTRRRAESSNRLNRRFSSGGIDSKSLRNSTNFLLGIDNWIRSKASMRIKRIVSCKRDTVHERSGREMRIRSMEDDSSCPRLLLLRRHQEEPHVTKNPEEKSGASAVNGVINMGKVETADEETAKMSAEGKTKLQKDDQDGQERIKTTHPLSPYPPPSPDHTDKCHINLPISRRGGDKDEEQVQGLREQAIEEKAKERKDVNGNISDQVTSAGSLTVNRKSISSVAQPLPLPPPTLTTTIPPPSAAGAAFFDNPVCESVIREEQEQEEAGRIRKEEHRERVQPKRNHRNQTEVWISCICSHVKQTHPTVITRSCMAGHESGSGSDQTHLQIESSQPSGTTVGQELLDRCTSLSLPIVAVHDFKYPIPATNPAFIRPSTSTSINSIVIEDEGISEDNDSVCNGQSPDRHHAKIVQEKKDSAPTLADSDSETTWSVIKELILAFLLAGLGNVAASYWLAKVQSWSVFKNIPQLVILVPPLIGLKGNVEMTLASRLSTHANLGHMDTKSGRRTIIMGNMALIQCQASTVGFIAPIIALGLSLMSERGRYLRWREIVLLVASSVITANVANLILGSLMCGVILLARKHHINPDNIATPIAASLGDVTTMILLANISHFLYVSLDTNQWVQNTLLAFLMALIPIWAYIARNNPFTRKVILNGWYPVCGAMLIQNAGGLVMERALKTFERIANLQLLINGVCGNLVAIQSSRMSTHLHKYSERKELPKTDPSSCTFPGSTFTSSTSVHTKMARILICLAIPSHLTFLLVTEFVNKKYFLTGPFIVIYLTIGAIHVAVLLQLAYNFVHWLWKVGVNPDNTAIPFLTAFADLVGSLLLFTSFVLLYLAGDPNAYDASRAANATAIASSSGFH